MTTRWGASVRTLRSHVISMFRSKSARLYWGHALAARGVLLRHAKDRDAKRAELLCRWNRRSSGTVILHVGFSFAFGVSRSSGAAQTSP